VEQEMTELFMNKQASCLQTIRESYPNLDIHSARLHTAEGQFNDILFINDDLIFRFPRYEESINDFLQEINILQRLPDHVGLPIPNPIYISSATRSVGRVFMGYKMLAGKPLFQDVLNGITNQVALDLIAGQLSDFLQELHQFSHTDLGLDLPVRDQLAETKSLFSDIEKHLFPLMRSDARDAVTRHFEDYFNRSYLHQYQPAMVHGDFGGSNILYDSGKITGIIDFSSAGLDDPALDMAAVSTLGDAFFARICRHYSPSESTLERARFYRGTYALQEALHGFRNNDEEAFRSGMEQYI
jgi:aminoglycoside 2''-phosphotransferase